MKSKIFGDKILVASSNKDKIREINEFLQAYDTEAISASIYNLPAPEENGINFAQNAIIKAKFYSEKTGLVALADDSGLEIEALNGAPGILSARWADNGKDFSKAINRIYEELQLSGFKNMRAKFTCALCLCLPDGKLEIFQGEIKGCLTFPAKGDKGFGYDPIFVPKGLVETFAQIDAELKNKISHRAIAFTKMRDFLVNLQNK